LGKMIGAQKTNQMKIRTLRPMGSKLSIWNNNSYDYYIEFLSISTIFLIGMCCVLGNEKKAKF
jgi:hypothetical protein